MGQDERQSCSSALAMPRQCCPNSSLKVLPWAWWDWEVHLHRIWRCGCWCELGQSRTNPGHLLVGICSISSKWFVEEWG